MWNLNALAQKAKEAAARLESQLDDSIGIEDDSLFGSKKSSSTNNNANVLETTQEHDDLNEHDDFFSDNHDVVKSDVVKKLDVTAEAEGDEFFTEDDGQLQEMDAAEEEVDFGGDDGWDEGDDDIALDDDLIEEPMQPSKEQPLGGQVDNAQESTIVSMPPIQDEVGDDENEKLTATDEGSTIVNMPPIQDAAEPIEEPEAVFLPSAEPVEESEAVTEVEPSEPIEQLCTEQREISDIAQSNVEQEIVNEISPQPRAAQMDETEKLQFLQTISQLEAQLLHREEQLASKSEQITSLTMQNEAETGKLRQVISETKEEAKKRVLKAKERVEEMQTKLAEAVKRADSAGGSSHEQSEIISALRAEGEQLARKQGQMEQSVRSAKAEVRELTEQLQIQTEAKETALQKITGMEKDIKSLKDDLATARRGESQSKKLEGDLVAAKEESEKQRVANLGLEQQLTELREENKTLNKEVQDAKQGAALDSERESNKLRKERDDMLGDLENKLRTSEREANVREDALRHEVSELRKRWQDAVRRAEDLSMDVQQSTAPLLRQLESTERQNRARASAWAELETKLRADLEEHVIQLEKLTKERNDLRASDKRLQRTLKEKDDEIASSQETIETLTATVESLEENVANLQVEQNKLHEAKEKLEKQASEGVAKVRSELSQSIIESEERHRSQIESLEAKVADERQRRESLMKQLDVLAQNINTVEFSQTSGVSTGEQSSSEQEQKLRGATNQASILHDTLLGMDSDNDDEEEDEVVNMQGGSFAAMEQLSQGLKAARLELETLRNQLASSEESREHLVAELAEMRQAAEKLTLFESKVSELTMETNLKDMELKGLQDDIADVKFLYRQQLDALLEEKAAQPRLSATLEDEEIDAIKNDAD